MAITDLTGCSWKGIKENLTFNNAGKFYLNFNYNGKNYSSIQITSKGLKFDNELVAGEEEQNMPVKGQIINLNMDGTTRQYRVLKTNGSQAEVIAMFDPNTSCPFNTGSCFEAGTQIMISLDGETKNIEDMKQDDIVISRNPKTGEFYEAFVKKVIIDENSIAMAKITTESGKELVMTENHPLLTVDGWKSLTGFGDYPVLTKKDILVCIDGEDKIASIKKYTAEKHATYNLDVVDKEERNADDNRDDNYIANGVVAHNPPSFGSNVYNGGELDVYLNTTWYGGLTTTAKNALVSKTLTQYQYSYNSDVYSADTHASYADYSTKSVKATGLSRKVYALDVEDIENYFNHTFSTADIWELFWNVRSRPSSPTYPWTRSARAGYSDNAWCVNGNSGGVSCFFVDFSRAARPAFTIDLSKISWS